MHICKNGHQVEGAGKCKQCIANASFRYWRKKHGVRETGRRRPSVLGVIGNTPERRVYDSMISRCTNPKNRHWKYYGGRGITVCEKWRQSYEAYLADVGPRPGPEYSLDRYPDNAGNYEPGNVRWATAGQQMRNTRRNRWVTFEGETMCLTDWGNRFGISAPALAYRLRNGTFPYGKLAKRGSKKAVEA